ncbi:helix-turn-helix domain-containing protein [Streptomyces sp. NPDC048442]|uniref:helix-turn-helix domain-containing protein n=1 Tax=Streptomyces sp. NPDC048442 TaxID=3154823 RepID=UPI00343167FE
MAQQFYSVDQVAGLLDLHVKTVRAYVREGRLRATRIGKQYRIAREDLEAFTGGSVTPAAPAPVLRTRHVEVSSIVQIDVIGPDEVSRLSNALMATVGSRHGSRGEGPYEDRVRVETVYDEERASLKVIALGSPAVTADLLKIVEALTSEAAETVGAARATEATGATRATGVTQEPEGAPPRG